MTVATVRLLTWEAEPTLERADRLIAAFRVAKDKFLKNSMAMAFAGWVAEQESIQDYEAACAALESGNLYAEIIHSSRWERLPPELVARLAEVKRDDFRFCRTDGAENYQVTFLRHLPFYPVERRPIQLPKQRLSPDLRAMALEIRAAKDFGLLPIFADLFEDAGCGNPEVLNHLRGPEGHYGRRADPKDTHTKCWSCAVVELVLASWECYQEVEG